MIAFVIVVAGFLYIAKVEGGEMNGATSPPLGTIREEDSFDSELSKGTSLGVNCCTIGPSESCSLSFMSKHQFTRVYSDGEASRPYNSTPLAFQV